MFGKILQLDGHKICDTVCLCIRTVEVARDRNPIQSGLSENIENVLAQAT
jgi:hypothetical protein